MRELQHNLAAVLDKVAGGEEISITRRGRVIARLVPARGRRRSVAWPDSAARMKRLACGVPRGAPPSRVIRETRQERI